jgi:hypothetical protein
VNYLNKKLTRRKVLSPKKIESKTASANLETPAETTSANTPPTYEQVEAGANAMLQQAATQIAGFVKPKLAKDIALKALISGPPGSGKSMFGYGVPASKGAPIMVIRTKPLDRTIQFYEERVEDGLIQVFETFDGLKEEEWNMERVAHNVQIATHRLAKMQAGTVILDDVTDYYQGLQAWMENLTDAKRIKSTGKPVRMEWARIYDRLISGLILVYRKPKIPVFIMSQIKDVFGSDAEIKREDGLTTPLHASRAPKEVDHLIDFKIEVASYYDYGPEISQYVEIPATETKLNIATFRKVRGWANNPRRDRFYDFVYPKLKSYMNSKGVNFYEPEGAEPFVPPNRF